MHYNAVAVDFGPFQDDRFFDPNSFTNWNICANTHIWSNLLYNWCKLKYYKKKLQIYDYLAKAFYIETLLYNTQLYNVFNLQQQ